MKDSGKPELFTTGQQQLGVVYAKALLAVGEESGSESELVEEIGVVADAVSDQPRLQDSLASPRVAMEEKVALVDRIFGQKVSPSMLQFLNVLVRKGRFDCLRAVRVSAEQILGERRGEVKATVTTAAEVDDHAKDRIAESLSKRLGKKVNLHAIVDPSIVGGMVVRVGDTVYDSSVVGQLQQVRTKAMKKAAESIREQLGKFTSDV